MNAVHQLEVMGVSVRIDDAGALSLSGLQSLSADDRQAALLLAKENKAAIMEALRPSSPVDDPTPEQIAHARRMVVDCPATGGKLHCWHCSRCDDAQRCMAWHHRRSDVEFFKKSGEPYSLFLVEGEAEPATKAASLIPYSCTAAANALPAWTDICPDYFMGCFDCPHYRASLLHFCGKFTREGVLQ